MCNILEGDFVHIKTWEDMENEFGVNGDGNIDCRYLFTIDMAPQETKRRI